MSYCSNCGGRLNDNGLCPNCGGVSKAKIPPQEKQTTEVLACLKMLFSRSPLKGVERAARTRSVSIWVTFGALYIITTIIGQISVFTSLPCTVLHGIFDKKMAQALSRIGTGEPLETIMPTFVSLTVYSAAMSLLSIVLISVMTWLLFLLAKERPSFSQALNISTFSMFPLSVCILISMAVSILSVPFTVGILVMGLLMSVIMYYFGIQKASEYKTSPFWFFVLAVFVGELILSLFSMIFTMLIF